MNNEELLALAETQSLIFGKARARDIVIEANAAKILGYNDWTYETIRVEVAGGKLMPRHFLVSAKYTADKLAAKSAAVEKASAPEVKEEVAADVETKIAETEQTTGDHAEVEEVSTGRALKLPECPLTAKEVKEKHRQALDGFAEALNGVLNIKAALATQLCNDIISLNISTETRMAQLSAIRSLNRAASQILIDEEDYLAKIINS